MTNRDIPESAIMLDFEQARRLVRALDFYSRVWIGQYRNIMLELSFHHPAGRTIGRELAPVIKAALTAIRALAIPQLAEESWGANFGIWSEDAKHISGNRAASAYDLQQVIRHATAWSLHPEGGHIVDFAKPILRGDWPAPACTCHGASEADFSFVIELVPEQHTLLGEATEAYADFLQLDLARMFTHFSDHARALELADTLSNILDDRLDDELRATCKKNARAIRLLSRFHSEARR